MGFFDKLVEMKKEHDRKVEEEKEKALLRREQKKKEEAEFMMRLESGELVQGILHEFRLSPWFLQSQGSWNCNRREIIITPFAILFDNYDKDVFFRNLCEVEPDGPKSVIYSIHKENEIVLREVGGHVYGEKNPTLETRQNEKILAQYKTSDSFCCEVLTYQRWGYDSITDSNILKKFATALKNVLEREYPKIKVSNIQKNKWGFLMLELVVEKVEGKNLFTEISSADESQIELRVQLQMVNRMFTLAKLSLWREEQTGEVKERTFDEVIGYAKEIIVLADRLTNLSEEEHQQIQSAYVTLACMLYEKHEMKFEQKTAGMEDLRQMIVAQKCFAKVLPFAKEQYTFDEIDKSMKYLFVLMNLRAFDENSDYIEEIEPSMRGFDYKREFYKIVFELYVKTRSFFKTEQRYDGYNRAIISELIKIKCDLGDFNGVDVYLEEYISTGSNDAERYYDYIEKKRRSCKSSCRN